MEEMIRCTQFIPCAAPTEALGEGTAPEPQPERPGARRSLASVLETEPLSPTVDDSTEQLQEKNANLLEQVAQLKAAKLQLEETSAQEKQALQLQIDTLKKENETMTSHLKSTRGARREPVATLRRSRTQNAQSSPAPPPRKPAVPVQRPLSRIAGSSPSNGSTQVNRSVPKLRLPTSESDTPSSAGPTSARPSSGGSLNSGARTARGTIRSEIGRPRSATATSRSSRAPVTFRQLGTSREQASDSTTPDSAASQISSTVKSAVRRSQSRPAPSRTARDAIQEDCAAEVKESVTESKPDSKSDNSPTLSGMRKPGFASKLKTPGSAISTPVASRTERKTTGTIGSGLKPPGTWSRERSKEPKEG